MSTSSSSSSEGGDDHGGAVESERPSSSRSRMRSSNGVWPEPFVEALAFQVAVDASRNVGRLAAAQALFSIFQVCSTWRAISRSELLWQNLSRSVWNAGYLIRNTWREEYICRHQTASNFRLRRYTYATLHFVPTDDNNNDALSCRRLAISNRHLAAGFADGAVRLFHISTRAHLSTFYPQQINRLGRFSSAVSGIVLSDVRLVFATVDGDVHTVVIGEHVAPPLRRAHLGDVVNDGVLVDFSGCDRWWVGLYAGVPGHSLRIWNGEREELLFVGGTVTDPEAVMGWHSLTELTDLLGRVRVTSDNVAVACTRLWAVVFDLQHQGLVLGEEEFQRNAIVGLFDAFNERALLADVRGAASVRRVVNLGEVCRFGLRGGGSVLGSVNGGYGFVCSSAGGVIRVWEIEHGQYLYSFMERVGECCALAADERYVAACSSDATVHVWDFGADQ